MKTYRIGGNTFENVLVPLLWGERAILQDDLGRLSVIDLGGQEQRREIVADKPAPGVEYVPAESGFQILRDGRPLYSYDPTERLLRAVDMDLPEIQIEESCIRIGDNNRFTGNQFTNWPVGIFVSGSGFGVGAPLPSSIETALRARRAG